MKIYKDKNLTEEVDKGEDFYLGIVPAGETKKFVLWILNDSLAHLVELVFSIEHSEVKIIEAPKELYPNEKGKLVFEWAASVTLKEGLKARLNVKAKELWD